VGLHAGSKCVAPHKFCVEVHVPGETEFAIGHLKVSSIDIHNAVKAYNNKLQNSPAGKMYTKNYQLKVNH